MGLFDKVFGKETCVLCGNECGALHRTKLRGGDYVCSDCVRKCSRLVRVSEMDKAAVEEHIRYMEWQDRLFAEVFEKARRETYPSAMDNQAISFADEIGMFAILQRSDPENKVFRELIRYDQVGSYERYEETEEENGQTRLRERGIKLHLLSPLDAGHLDADKAKKGLRAHPYIRHEIKVVFAKADKGGADYTINAIAHFDHIFGAHDNDTALFSFKGSKQQQRNFAAQKDLSDLIGGAIKAARSGQAEPDEALAAQFEKTQASMASANTGGMSVYSKRADDAEHQVSR